MGRTLFNLHLDALAFIREITGCEYSTALRLGQLYAYLEHMTSQGGAVQFNQSAFCERTGCSRPGLRADLQRLAEQGWIAINSSARGPKVRVVGLPFQEIREVLIANEVTPTEHRCPMDCTGAHRGATDTECLTSPRTLAVATEPSGDTATEPEPTDDLPDEEGELIPIWKTRPRPWTRIKREQVRKLWNENKPSNFALLGDNGLDADRAATLARSMDGRGGFKALVQLLPRVLERLQGDPFWGDSSKRFTFDNFFGTVHSRKPHLAQQLDSVLTSSCQDSEANKANVRYEAFGHQWIPLKSGLSCDEIILAAVQLVKSGQAPRESLQHLNGGWSEDHPHMRLLDD